MMDPVIEPLAARLAQIRLAPPTIRIMSTVTARWLSDAEATSTALLGRAPAAARALRTGRCRFARRLAAACCSRSGRARRCRRWPGRRASARGPCRRQSRRWPTPPSGSPKRSPLRSARSGRSAPRSIGTAYRRTERRRRLPLPAYPFQRHAPLGRGTRGVRATRCHTLAAGCGRDGRGGTRRHRNADVTPSSCRSSRPAGRVDRRVGRRGVGSRRHHR